jgi:hypothetical protein
MAQVEYVYYFAFGSNLDPGVFIVRRKMQPTEFIPGVLPKWQLTFDYGCAPGVEPCFGNVKENESSEVHGVVYKITTNDFDNLLSTEGSSYNTVKFDIHTYDGRVLSAYTLVVPQNNPLILKTLDVPSTRYMNLIRTGAKYHQLHPDYIKYLDDLPSLKPSTLGIILLCVEALFIVVLGSPIWFSMIMYQFFFPSARLRRSFSSEARSTFFRFTIEGVRLFHRFFSSLKSRGSNGQAAAPYSSPAFPLNSTNYRDFYKSSPRSSK